MMKDCFLKRRARKQSHDLLRHSVHLRNMRADLMPDAVLQTLRNAEAALRDAVAAGDLARMERDGQRLQAAVVKHAPRRNFPGVRENVEILVVAIAIAMACRTYFIQPFKIPTGSMQPTLNGIQYQAVDKAGLTDRMPLRIVRWLIFGEWYREVRAQTSGYVARDPTAYEHGNADEMTFYIGNSRHVVPREGFRGLQLGAYVEQGTVLWRGRKVAGDHVFVDKLRWNINRPKRGQIMVFNTDNIDGLPPKTHYIKRLVGLPGETLSISPPNLLVNGAALAEPEPIARIERRDAGYAGYQLVEGGFAGNGGDWAMRRATDRISLAADEYFALGDNTTNSKDGRYWGAVPQPNLVGPAVVVYWPFSKRWGLAD